MATAKKMKFNLFLTHQATGQRYPVGDELVIGRAHGEILFPEDPKVSSQHCRIVRTPKGLAVHDLESSNGTFLDGTKLDPKKLYALKAGNKLSVGHQEMRLEETKASVMKPLARKHRSKKKRKKGSFDFPTFVAGCALIGAVAFIAHTYLVSPKAQKEANFEKLEMHTPLDLVEKEMRDAFDDYAQLGKNHTDKTITDKQLSNSIRKTLIPKLNRARVKMEVIRPQSEWETRKLEANKGLLSAVIKQVDAMASFTETKVPKFGKDLEAASAAVEKWSFEVRVLDEARSPAGR